MYTKFFGFKEKPFRLVPDPAYLYLSKSHEEAMAHLNYALAHGDGFLEITGEVGTGKTTLCRAFLAAVDKNTRVAYIFNPGLDPKQLIKTINDELGVSYDNDNIKDLTDQLNRFLMQQKTTGQRVILLIDEAQNLQTNVLEQLRLLSNLETEKEKLLQIILIGQPELGQMLDSYNLRQIGQRISLRYQLRPLNYNETKAYIQYRLNIASRNKGPKFDRAALRKIFNYSRGIPRVINVACDRIFLTAYGLNQRHITGGITKASIKELIRPGVSQPFVLTGYWPAFVVVAFLSIAAAGLFFYFPANSGINDLLAFWQRTPQMESASVYSTPQQNKTPTTATPDPAPANEPELSSSPQPQPSMQSEHLSLAQPGQFSSQPPEPIAPPQTKTAPDQPETTRTETSHVSEHPPSQVPTSTPEVAEAPAIAQKQPQIIDLKDYPAPENHHVSRYQALKHAFDLWKTTLVETPYLNGLTDDRAYFRLYAQANGLSIYRIKTDLDQLMRLNLPAILEILFTKSRSLGYLTLDAVDGRRITLGGTADNTQVATDLDEINFYWTGIAYIPWKNFRAIIGKPPIQRHKDSILTLKLLLHDLGFRQLEIDPVYDQATQTVIKEIQHNHGIPVDGIVGPMTKIMLYRSANRFEMPQIVRAED